MKALLGFFTPWVIYFLITLLNYFVPGRKMAGYVTDSKTGELLHYRLNGRIVLLITVALWAILGWLNWVPFDWLYEIRWYSLAGAFTFGLIFSLAIVLPYPSTGKPFLVDLFFGRLENPQFQKGRIDAKMWLYLIGAVMLELNVLSFVAHHYNSFGSLSPNILLCGAMITFFVVDYLSFEKVHLYTYDFFAERVGVKLGWGCLTFYPFLYAVVPWSTVDLPAAHTPVWGLVIFGLIFLMGWTLARGANMQKYFFKINPTRSFLGIKPQTISDGNKTLLVNGFWGVSRHINYLGEVLMGVGIALSVGYPDVYWVWIYPLYYVLLLFPRQYADDKRCQRKYGDLWKQYTQKVPYRIIPFIY